MTRTRTSSTPWSQINQCSFMSMTDTVVTDFKKRVANGELLCNPMVSGCYHASKVTPGSLKYDRFYREWGNRWVLIGTYVLPLSPLERQFSPYGYGSDPAYTVLSWVAAKTGLVTTAALSDSEISAMHTALSAKLAAGMTQSLVSMVEMPKTIKMIADALEILRHPYRYAKEKLRLSREAIRNDPGARRRLFDCASDAWMQSRFGWRPLVYDIVGHLEAAEKDFSVRQTVRSSYPFQKAEEIAMRPITDSNFGSGRPYAQETWTLTGRIDYRLGQTGDMAIDYGNFQHFGALDPLGTLWELVTLSWAVDYFLNVSDMLQSLQAYALLDERVGWTTRRVSGEATVSYEVVAPEYTWEYERGANCVLTPAYAREKYTGVVRVPRTDFTPYLKSRIDLSTSKILDLAAVVRNLYKGYLRR